MPQRVRLNEGLIRALIPWFGGHAARSLTCAQEEFVNIDMFVVLDAFRDHGQREKQHGRARHSERWISAVFILNGDPLKREFLCKCISKGDAKGL